MAPTLKAFILPYIMLSMTQLNPVHLVVNAQIPVELSPSVWSGKMHVSPMRTVHVDKNVVPLAVARFASTQKNMPKES